jgi:ribose 5-phosphate isomerase B
MKIALGADHAGYGLKEHLRRFLEAEGHTVQDFGTRSEESTDYPDYAAAVGRAVAAGEAERGVLVCGTGIGMAMAANKIPGVRAANCFEPYTAALSREHNDANVLTVAARISAAPYAEEIVRTFLATPFAGGRHARRTGKIDQLS